MFRQRRHSAFRRASWLALFAILLQVVVPIVHQPGGAARAGPLSAAGANLCSAPGNGPASPVGTDKSPTHKLPPCPICQTFQMLSGGFVPPSPATFAAIDRAGSAPAPSAYTAIRRRWTTANAQARAPPLRA